MLKELLGQIRGSAEVSAAHSITKNSADVIFMQEVGKEDRQFVSALKTEKYVMQHVEGHAFFNTAIALNPNRFTRITPYSCTFPGRHGAKDCAICVATDKTTGKRFAFVSAHIPGFPYQATGQDLKDKAAAGNALCQALLAKMEEIKAQEKANGTPIDSVIIGSDVNASPEKLKSRFDVFTQEGFEVKRSGSPTNVHFMDAQHPLRELDYFLAQTKPKTSLFGRVKAFFRGRDEHIQVSASSFPHFGFDTAHNMSDHKPIAGKVLVTKKASLASKVRNAFSKKAPPVDWKAAPDLSKISAEEFAAWLAKLEQEIAQSEFSGPKKRAETLDLTLAMLATLLPAVDKLAPENRTDAIKATTYDSVNRIMQKHKELLEEHNLVHFSEVDYSNNASMPSNVPSAMMNEGMPNGLAYLQHSLRKQ